MIHDSSTHWRSLLKAISWETISWFLTAGIAYWYLGSVQESSGFATVCLGVKVVFLYLHERSWHQIPIGKRHETQNLRESMGASLRKAVAERTARDV